MDRAPVVAIIGGSLGGLTAACVLRDAGCEVDVFERSAGALQGRGAGIAALEQTLRYPVRRAGVPLENFCSTTGWIRFLHPAGSVRYERRHRYVFSSWNAVYRALMTGFPAQHYHLGHEMASFRDVGAKVEVTFANSKARRVDLLVCADGITSTARARLLPGARPVSVPPGMVSPELVRGNARPGAPTARPPIAEFVLRIEEPFIQAVFDIDVPQMAFGRVCLLGDAAFAARPHAAAGTAKAAEDGWVLGEELLNAGGDVPAALRSWQHRQLKLGAELLARTRWIGDTAQFGAGPTPGDPRLIFGLYEPGR